MRVLIMIIAFVFCTAAAVTACSKEEVRVKTGQLSSMMAKYYDDKNYKNVKYIVEKRNGQVDKRYNDLEELARDYLHFCKKRPDPSRCEQTEYWLSAYDDEDVRYMIAHVSFF